MSKLTVDGMFAPPKICRSSTTSMFSTWRCAVFPFLLIDSALSGTRSVQTRSEGAIPPLKSCSCDPEPGS